MQSIKDTVKEVVYAILPLSLVVILLQVTVIGMPPPGCLFSFSPGR